MNQNQISGVEVKVEGIKIERAPKLYNITKQITNLKTLSQPVSKIKAKNVLYVNLSAVI